MGIPAGRADWRKLIERMATLMLPLLAKTGQFGSRFGDSSLPLSETDAFRIGALQQ